MKVRVASAALCVLLAGCGQEPPSVPEPAAAPTTAAPSPSARPDVPAAGDQQIHLSWDGKARTAAVHAPPAYRAGLPVVVALHYADGNATLMAQMSGLSAKADRAGFIVVYPEGLGGSFNALGCCGRDDDAGFVKELIRHMIDVWHADPRRVYATGISNGAAMSYRLAVEASDLIAAVAPVSGGFNGQITENPAYRPAHPVPVVAFIGGNDASSTYLDGLRAWTSRLRCGPVRQSWWDAARTIQQASTHCADGSDVVWYVIAGMKHRWPGGTTAGLGDPDTKINAVDVMWAFFAAHPRK